MNLYDGIKDIAKIVRKADNIELYQELLELRDRARVMQVEISRLKEENERLKKEKDISDRIVRHPESSITLKGSSPTFYYCTHCWDSNSQLIQLKCNDYYGTFECPHCQMNGIYDKERYHVAKQLLETENDMSEIVSY